MGSSFLPIRAGVYVVLASGDYLLSTIANGVTQAPMLINDRIGTTTALDPRCVADGLGDPWALISCAPSPDPLGPYDLELYALAGGARQVVTPNPGLPQCSPYSACAGPDGVGAYWIRWDATCYHCGDTYFFQNIQTGELRDDPTNATTFADLNSLSLARKTCSRVRVMREFDLFSERWGSLAVYGQFALATGTDSGGTGGAFLERCGSPLRRLLASGPYGGSGRLPLASNSHVIVWQASPRGLSGLFLPSLQMFTIPLPSAIVTAQGSPVFSTTRVAAVALTAGALYVLDGPGGTLWRTATPSALPLNTSRPMLTRSGGTLTCGRGSWRNAVRFSYAWRVDGVAKIGASKSSLAVGKALSRRSVSCSVIASNVAGTTSASSAQIHVR